MVEPPNGLDDAPPKPPKPAGALAGAAALLKLNGAGLAAVPPNAEPLKLKAELLAAPNGGVEAPPPKAGVLKPANNEPEAAGWLCGAALALAKLKAEEEAPKRPVEMCPRFSEGSHLIFDEVGLNLAFCVNHTSCAGSKDGVGCSKLRGCGRARSSEIKSGGLSLSKRHMSMRRVIHELTRKNYKTAMGEIGRKVTGVDAGVPPKLNAMLCISGITAEYTNGNYMQMK